jgi:3',5'-cyclic AMP phosphodiesterase CpdA
MQRRKFLENVIFGSTVLSFPLALAGCNRSSKKIKFGICADVHKDIMHDADFRLSEFIESARENNPDFIIQLGDFCRPYDSNKSFMDVWNGFPGPRYHVLGNHDTDGGFTREQTLVFWGAEKKYYSFDSGDFHFVVLDGNEKNPSEDRAPGYARYIGKEQQEWLRQDLRSAEKPVIVFSHQSLENEDGIENRQEIRKILTDANTEAGFTKVVACFSGHHHTDYYVKAQGIYYIQINSMSYNWVGGDYQTIRYSQEIDEKYPWIKYTIPYKDPLFAFVTIKDGMMEIRGKKTEFVGPGPDELGFVKPGISPVVPYISDNKILIT